MTHDPAKPWVERTLSTIQQESFRQEALKRAVAFDETSWAVGTITNEALERVAYFLDSLVRRSPMNGPGWAAHKHVIEAIVSDMQREIAKREGEAGG